MRCRSRFTSSVPSQHVRNSRTFSPHNLDPAHAFSVGVIVLFVLVLIRFCLEISILTTTYQTRFLRQGLPSMQIDTLWLAQRVRCRVLRRVRPASNLDCRSGRVPRPQQHRGVRVDPEAEGSPEIDVHGTRLQLAQFVRTKHDLASVASAVFARLTDTSSGASGSQKTNWINS